ncbi:PPE family protein, SVP subgroup [Mycobacterium parmense]|uniref:PE family protein n=1 Tax=Mycobacterium parmense TaxID=185642 RepID=A0A7I7YSE7_9MYCO|nr:PE domain-containing protein [Mycobacterium parmense]MCV7349442.1 PE domain-containing protein [Mycobacterium parmense]ORW49915.1 hypothetical protein AWC20_24370 [Mycobacterium parmense]BBZ43933.1 PE family protein [Mycobacterium parmense]
MSFVTTRVEALTGAAARLQTIGAAMADENAAAAMPTTGVAPAAADEVSALQAGLFSTYGSWYQHVSAQAAAIHRQLVSTLQANAGSYGETEAANQVTTASTPAQSLLSDLASSDSIIGTPIGFAQNFPAAASDLFSLGPGLTTTPSAVPPGVGIVSAAGPAIAADAVTPAGAATPGTAVVSATSGAAPSIGGMSAPPSWAAGGATAGPAPVTLTGAHWTNAATQPSSTTVPAGLPSAAAAGRGGSGFGAPRYGAKPTVMPRPTVV